MYFGASLVAEMVKNVGSLGLIPRLGRSPGGGRGNPLQYSCWENPMDRGNCGPQSMGHKDSDMTERLSTHTHTHTHIYLSFS